MSIEKGSKWVKDGEVVEIENILKSPRSMGWVDVIWYICENKKFHVMLVVDFLEQYKPYEPVYEYRYCYISYFGEICISNGFFKNDDEMKTIIALKENSKDFQRLDFTKRERKC